MIVYQQIYEQDRDGYNLPICSTIIADVNENTLDEKYVILNKL